MNVLSRSVDFDVTVLNIHRFAIHVRFSMDDLKKYPASTKLLLSCSTGYVSGVVVKKIGKLAAFSIGASIIMNVIYQEARRKHFFQIIDPKDEEKLEKSVTVFQEGFTARWKNFFVALGKYDNVLYSGFVGGFLIGLS